MKTAAREPASECCQWHGDDLILRLRVQPRASKDEILGPQGDRLKVRVTAPPVDGQANRHLVRFLAKAFGVPRARVVLLGGQTSKDKRLLIRAPGKLPASVPKPARKLLHATTQSPGKSPAET